MLLQTPTDIQLSLIYLQQKKKAQFPRFFEKTRSSFFIPSWGKQKYQVTNADVKSEIVTFTASTHY